MKVDRVRGHLDLLLLGVLSDGPLHGYGVITALRDGTDGMLELTEGAVYPALHRLEDLGLLTAEWSPAGGRRRKVYRLTPSGEKSLASEATEWRALANAVDSVLRRFEAQPFRTRTAGAL